MQELNLIKVTLIDGPADGETTVTPSENTLIRYTKFGESHHYVRDLGFDYLDTFDRTYFYYEGPVDG